MKTFFPVIELLVKGRWYSDIHTTMSKGGRRAGKEVEAKVNEDDNIVANETKSSASGTVSLC
jgi:hypothetical protein